MRLCCDANVIVLLLEVNGVFTHNATSDIVDVECTLCHQYKKKRKERREVGISNDFYINK